jgi:hypothetical protein
VSSRAEDELGVLRRFGDDGADVLLDHRPGRAAHRREGVDHLDLRTLDLDVVEEAELDDVHPQPGILDEVEGVYDFYS